MSYYYLTPLKSSFTPRSISGLTIWIDFSDSSTVTTVSNLISQVNDKSANAYTLTQGTSGNRPSYVAATLNSLPVATFDGTNDFVSGNCGSNLSTYTMFVVFRTANLRQFNALIQTTGTFSTGSMTFEQGSGGQIDVFVSNVGSRLATGGSSITTGTWYRGCVQYTSATPTGEIFLNNVSKNTTNVASAFLDVTPFSIGYDNGAGFFAWNGDCAEVIVYNSVLNSTQRTQVDNYLKLKYNL